ncbi:hypothetical protein BDK51DRAFT_46695, partial [Blyttiomyces helicus]
ACVYEDIKLRNAVPKSWYVPKAAPLDQNAIRDLATGAASIADSMDALASLFGVATAPMGGAVETSKEDEEPQIDDKDPRVWNTRCFRHLLTQIPAVLTDTFQGVMKLLMGRRIADVASRKSAQKIVDDLAVMLRDAMIWRRAERSTPCLHTSLVIAFKKAEGIDELFKLLEKLWLELSLAFASMSSSDTSSPDDRFSRTHVDLQVCISIIQSLCSNKVLNDSPHTATLIAREKDKTSADYFSPSEHLIEMRARAAPHVLKMWRSVELRKCGPSIVKPLISILSHLLKADGEVVTTRETAAVNGASGSGAGAAGPLSSFAQNLLNSVAPQSAQPDPEKVQQLCDMGFPRAAAETALVRCALRRLRRPRPLRRVRRFTSAPEAAAPAVPASSDEAAAAAPAPASASEATSSTAGDADVEMGEGSAAGVGDEEELAAALALSMDTPDSAEDGTPADPMATDATAEPEQPKEDKGKGKAVSYKDELDVLRKDLKPEIVQSALALLEFVDDVVFDVKDLICLASAPNISDVVVLLIADIAKQRETASASPESSDVAKAVAVRLHLFALIASDPALQKEVVTLSHQFIRSLTQMVSADAAVLPSLSSVLLILESHISCTDEPKPVQIEHIVEGAAKPKELPEDKRPDPFTLAERVGLLEQCIAVLKVDSLKADTLNSLLRLVVRLTRTHSLAVEFARQGGIPLLFGANRIGLFPAQPAMTIMILRHVIEDAAILRQTIERELTAWFGTTSRPGAPRVVDALSMLRNTAQIVVRDPAVFVDVAGNTCQLSRYDPSGRVNHITLRTKEAEGEKDAEGKEKDVKEKGPAGPSKSDQDEEMIVEPTPAPASAVPPTTPGAPSHEPLKTTYLSEVSEGVVQFLVAEILSMRTASTTSPTASGVPIVALLTAESEKAKKPELTVDASKPAAVPEVKEDDERALVHVRRCFILQCLSELLVAYPSCKVDLINVPHKRSGKATTPHKVVTSGRSAFLSYLLNDVLPHGIPPTPDPAAPAPADLESRRKVIESGWATTVFSALCIGIAPDLAEEKRLYPDLATVRRTVLEAIARSLRDAIASQDSAIDLKYARFLSLSTLCYKILTARQSTSAQSAAPTRADNDIATHVARCMLDKGFVGLLTQLLAEVDVHYPGAADVVGAALKPLENLSKLAIRIGRAVGAVPGDGKKRPGATPGRGAAAGGSESAASRLAEEAEAAGGPVPPPPQEDNPEVRDLYRNSALGMFGAPTSGEESEGLTDDEDEEGYDEEFTDESGEEDLEEDSDIEDPMEIIVPQPYHGGHDVDMSTDDEGHDDGGDHHDDDDDDDEDDEDDLDDGDDSEGDMIWDSADGGDGHYHAEIILGGEDQDDNHANADNDHGDDEDDHGDQDEESEEGDEEGHDGEESAGEGDETHPDETEESDGEGGEGYDDGLGSAYYDDLFSGETQDLASPHDHLSAATDNLIAALRAGRPRSRRLARRPIVDAGMGATGLDIHWVDEAGANPYDAEFPVIGRTVAPRPFSSDDMAHPLLVNSSTRGPAGSARADALGHSRMAAAMRAGETLDWQSFDDMIGGNALQILEQILRTGRTAMGTIGLQYRAELGHPAGAGLGAGGLVTGHGIPVPRPTGFSSGPASAMAAAAPVSTVDEQVANINAFNPISTLDRWLMEARLINGATFQEKASRALNALLNSLAPAAIEADRKRKEKEEIARKAREEARRVEELARKKQAEEDAKRKAEEEAEEAKRKAEKEAAQAAAEEATRLARGPETDAAMEEASPEPTSATSDATQVPTPMETEASSSTSGAPVEAPAAEPAERVIVVIDGRQVDITGSGIDVTFLEALPDDLRREVVGQHLREQQRSQRAAATPPTISTEFLEALPPEIREEVLLQERLERQRAAPAPTAAAPGGATAIPTEIDPASFLASLDPVLRQTVLLEQDDVFLATLPPALVAEANAIR